MRHDQPRLKNLRKHYTEIKTSRETKRKETKHRQNCCVFVQSILLELLTIRRVTVPSFTITSLTHLRIIVRKELII